MTGVTALTGKNAMPEYETTGKALQLWGEAETQNPDFVRALAETKLAALCGVEEYNNHFTKSPFSKEDFEHIKSILKDAIETPPSLPFDYLQGGAGTAINMWINEYISSEFSKNSNASPEIKRKIDPIEDCNMFQSTNDIIPTAITIYLYRQLEQIETQCVELQELLVAGEREHTFKLITARTQLRPALPFSLGQVYAGWAGPVERDRWRLSKLRERIRTVALGGTAVGSCFFAPREYILAAEKYLKALTHLPICRSQNLPDEISNQDSYLELAGAYQLCAVNLLKITSDASLYIMNEELTHPELITASSIMAAKTNPVLLEHVRGLCMFVQGEFQKIQLYAQNGQLQLNAFSPFVIESFRTMHRALKKAFASCIQILPQLTYNKIAAERKLFSSPAVLNALRDTLDYDVLKKCYSQTGSEQTKESFAALLKEHSDLSETEIERLLSPEHLCGQRI